MYFFFSTSYVTSDIVYADSALNSFSDYMYQVKIKFPFDSYDIAVAMTS